MVFSTGLFPVLDHTCGQMEIEELPLAVRELLFLWKLGLAISLPHFCNFLRRFSAWNLDGKSEGGKKKKMDPFRQRVLQHRLVGVFQVLQFLRGFTGCNAGADRC